MGIRGLTTFIQNRSHLYLEEFELHDTNIVIDGNAIACQLYKWHCKSNDCFGGDYDKFAVVIENFFQILSDCNVIPYVVFDGGYETRKIATVITRMKNKIKSAQQLNSVTEGSISVFPLCLRDTFQDIVLKLNIKCVRCDFEGDTETANIARTLNCPVLSYDSDFFIFDVLYIPFSTFKMCTRKKKIAKNEPFTYISCKVYRIEKFLNSFGGLDKTNLPILAVLLGNDYVKRSVFSIFFQNLKIQRCHGNQSDQQKRIKSLIIWLQNESIQSAVQKVLSRYKCKRRKLIAEKIQNAIKGYHCTDSIYLEYLEISAFYCEKNKEMLNIDYTIDENDEELENSESDVSDSEEASLENEEIDLNSNNDELYSNVQTIFLEKFRKCLYPPCFMDILIQNKYYCVPQVENDSEECSHTISFDILSAIQGILRNSKDNLKCILRSNNGQVKRVLLPHCDFNVPSLKEIQSINVTERKSILLQVLKIDNSFIKNCLNLFPPSWHLFIITIKYLIDKSVIIWPIVYALILCKIFLDHVNKHIGVCHSMKTLEKRIAKIHDPAANKDANNSFKLTIIDALADINCNESLLCFKSLFSYFNLDAKMKISNRLFDKNVLHFAAKFQSCLLHVKYLNSLLNLPFPNFIISDIFNGTFVYNLSVNFMKRTNMDSYIALFLQDTPKVLNSYKLIIEKLQEYGNNIKCIDPPKRRRKKKKQQKEVLMPVYKQDSSDEETTFDPNNKFSLLIFSEQCTQFQ